MMELKSCVFSTTYEKESTPATEPGLAIELLSDAMKFARTKRRMMWSLITLSYYTRGYKAYENNAKVSKRNGTVTGEERRES